MSGKLTAAQIDWVADFCEMPSLRQVVTPAQQDYLADISDEPPPAASPYATAPAGTPSAAAAAPPADPPPSAPIDKSKLELVQSDRLAELDKAVSSGLLERMQEAERQAGQMQGIAAIHDVDLNNPAAALAPLKKAAAGALDKHDQNELKLGLGLLNAAKDTLNNALIYLRAESMTLRRSLEALRNVPKPPEAKTEENKPERDTAEHAYDGAVQALKFLAELPDAITTVGKSLLQAVGGYVSAALELVGLDYLKDKVKGGNSDELLASLKTAVDELQGKVGDIITQLKQDAAEQAADAQVTLESSLRAVLEQHDHFVNVADQFDEQLKTAIAQVMSARGGKRSSASEEIKGIMAVHQAVLDAAAAGQEAAVALSQQGKVLGDLRYWESVLVPLGKREHDGRVMSVEANEYMVYLHGSRRIAFILPSAGLKNSVEDLSGAIQMIRKLYPTGGAEIEKLRDRWMSAMVAAL
jgi:hypothetical protein